MIVFFNLYNTDRPPERRKHEVCMSHPLLLRRACNGSVYGIKNDPFTLKNSHNLTVKILNLTEKIRLFIENISLFTENIRLFTSEIRLQF